MLTVADHFERRARERPQAIALATSRIRLTYAQLDGLADALAARLVSAGVAPGDRVVVHLARCPEAVISFLAILKAGACYVPLEPTYPIAVKSDYVERCGARHAILRGLDIGSCPTHGLALHLADDLLRSPPACSGPPRVPRHADGAAYVMFTSGSTGRPKGVVVADRGIVRLVRDTSYISIQEGDVLLLLSALSFDASTFELWGALLNGARLVIYDEPTFDPNRLAALITEHRVSVLWLTAALFHLMARRCVRAFEGVRVLLAGGDVVYAAAVNAALDAHPCLTVINGYGPTENTTFTCCHVMTRANRPGAEVPIGLPIDGTTVHLLDDELQPVADGEVGELFASGLGVALGYLDEPGLRSESFLRFTPGSDLAYRTGDMVRREPSGVIAYVGRRDRVVKVRGFRVSLDEVRIAILAVTGVDDCSVDLARSPEGENRLVAIVQAIDGGDGLGTRIRAHLRESMPAYMVPDLLDIRRQFPVTLNGKIDRRALFDELSPLRTQTDHA